MDEEVIKKNEGTLDGRKRLITLAVMLLLLILSSVAILVFLLNVEFKQPSAEGENAAVLSGDRSREGDVLPLGSEEPLPSPDLLPQRRLLLMDELGALLEKTVPRIEETGDGNVQWLYDRTTPNALMTANFYVYLGSGEDAIRGRFFAGCILKVPVLADRLIIDVDGTVYTIGIQNNDLKQRGLDYIGETHEFVDLPLDDYADILRHVGHGENVFVCFRGEEREHRFQLTQAQIDAVARMMRILSIREELDEDEKARARQ